MGIGWDLDKVLCGRTAVEFVRENFPDVTFNEVYGRTICLIPDHFTTEYQAPFFQAFRNLFQVELQQKVVELKPVRGVGDSNEQSAQDMLRQIFEYDFEDCNTGRGRLVRYSAENYGYAKPVAGKKYKVYSAQDGDGELATRSSVSLATTFNSKWIVGVHTYECVPSGERYNYQPSYVLRDSVALLLVPHDRVQ